MTELPPTVLIIDDEPAIRRFLSAGFELEGFGVLEAETGQAGLKSATFRAVDVIILDLGLPDGDGSRVLERLREWSTIPVIVLSVRANEDDKVRLLELGADDYVVKPFGMAELVARVRAAIRRHSRGQTGEASVTVGDLLIDLAHRRVLRRGEPVNLAPKEYRVLHLLARHAGNVVTQRQLLREVWGPAHEDATHYLRIVIRKLRKKLEDLPTQPTYVLTELGVGYRLAQRPPPRND